jgi:hypothetical protein
MWFVDKLGPAPGAAPSPSNQRPNGAGKAQISAQRSQPAAAKPAAVKAAPPPEPEKKKKKGWF